MKKNTVCMWIGVLGILFSSLNAEFSAEVKEQLNEVKTKLNGEMKKRLKPYIVSDSLAQRIPLAGSVTAGIVASILAGKITGMIIPINSSAGFGFACATGLIVFFGSSWALYEWSNKKIQRYTARGNYLSTKATFKSISIQLAQLERQAMISFETLDALAHDVAEAHDTLSRLEGALQAIYDSRSEDENNMDHVIYDACVKSEDQLVDFNKRIDALRLHAYKQAA